MELVTREDSGEAFASVGAKGMQHLTALLEPTTIPQQGLLFFVKSSGGWVKIKLKLPHFHDAPPVMPSGHLAISRAPAASRGCKGHWYQVVVLVLGEPQLQLGDCQEERHNRCTTYYTSKRFLHQTLNTASFSPALFLLSPTASRRPERGPRGQGLLQPRAKAHAQGVRHHSGGAQLLRQKPSRPRSPPLVPFGRVEVWRTTDGP